LEIGREVIEMNTITETYEQRIEREKAENIAFNKKAHSLFRQVAEMLGMEEINKSRDAQWRGESREFTDGRRTIWLSSGCYSNKDGTLSAAGTYPKNSKGEATWPCGYNGINPKINISIKKTAENIAKEIRSRLYPLYDPLLEKAEAEVKSSNNYWDITAKTWEALGVKQPQDGREANLYSDKAHGSLRVSGNSIRLTLDGIEDTAIVKALLKSLGLLK
jgi:hypothetical protein